MTKIAVIETGGKQYVVEDGTVFTTEKLASDKGKVKFDKVLLVDDGKEVKVGAPYISGAEVSAQVLEDGKADKVLVLRYRQKSRWKKAKGHRQPFTKLKVIKV